MRLFGIFNRIYTINTKQTIIIIIIIIIIIKPQQTKERKKAKQLCLQPRTKGGLISQSNPEGDVKDFLTGLEH